MIVYRELHTLTDILDGHEHQIRLLDLPRPMLSRSQVEQIIDRPLVRQTSQARPACLDHRNDWVIGLSVGRRHWI